LDWKEENYAFDDRSFLWPIVRPTLVQPWTRRWCLGLWNLFGRVKTLRNFIRVWFLAYVGQCLGDLAQDYASL
jgi:hypothetical protein